MSDVHTLVATWAWQHDIHGPGMRATHLVSRNQETRVMQDATIFKAQMQRVS